MSCYSDKPVTAPAAFESKRAAGASINFVSHQVFDAAGMC